MAKKETSPLEQKFQILLLRNYVAGFRAGIKQIDRFLEDTEAMLGVEKPKDIQEFLKSFAKESVDK